MDVGNELDVGGAVFAAKLCIGEVIECARMIGAIRTGAFPENAPHRTFRPP